MGRHSKPSTPSVNVAKIAVTGAVLSGGSLALAAPSHAATDDEWDTVARCESSGNWSINTGNGYQGGLQFSPSTWSGYGGGQFATAAHLASREQQIAIAEKVLAGQGRGAWPVCGRGLSGPTPRNVLTPAPVEDVTPDDPEASVTELGAPAPEAGPADAVAPLGLPAPQDLPGDAPVIDVITISTEGDGSPAGDLTIISDPQDNAIDTAPPEGVVIVEAGGRAPAPLAPADPAVPPVTPTTPAPTDSAAAPAPAANATTSTGGSTTSVVAGQVGVPHLPSPDNPPPGTSDDPIAGTENQNVSYLKDLWHAVQNNQISRSDLLLALAQRSFTAPVPGGTQTSASGSPAPGPADASAPVLIPAPAPADAPVVPAG